MTKMKAIKAYFEAAPHGRKVTLDELKALSEGDRVELASLAAAELGCELVSACAAGAGAGGKRPPPAVRGLPRRSGLRLSDEQRPACRDRRPFRPGGVRGVPVRRPQP